MAKVFNAGLDGDANVLDSTALYDRLYLPQTPAQTSKIDDLFADTAFNLTAFAKDGGQAGQPGETTQDVTLQGLFFSEYVDGSDFNKAVEIYNNTGALIDFSTVNVFVGYIFDGGNDVQFWNQLRGTLSAGETLVLVHEFAGQDLGDNADVKDNLFNHTGDDHIFLMEDFSTIGAGGSIIDLIGTPADSNGFFVDPGSQWESNGVDTANQTLRRNASVTQGNPNGFGTDVSGLSAEWTAFAQDTFGGIGSHTAMPRDTTAPTLTASNPADDAELLTGLTQLTLTFDEDMAAGTGNIIVRSQDDDTAVDTIDVTSLSVGIVGNVVTITLTAELGEGDYYLDIASGVFEDTSGNAFAGLTTNEDLDFSIAFKGGAGADTITGNATDDRLVGRGGNDIIFGGDGADSISGGEGNDSLHGQGGADNMFGNLGFDRLKGYAGDDILWGGAGGDRLFGMDDDDTLYGQRGNDFLYGGEGNDMLFGGGFSDQLFGGNGTDQLFGGFGQDVLNGGAGNDQLFGDFGLDILNGGDDNDQLFGGNGDDQLFGGSGDDRLSGGSSFDVLTGGAGDDVFINDNDGVVDRVQDYTPGEDTVEIAAGLQGFVTLVDTGSNIELSIASVLEMRFINVANTSDITIDYV